MNGILLDTNALLWTLADSARQTGLTELVFRAHQPAILTEFPALARHDTFDRMLLAQACYERLFLLTSDRHLLDLGLEWVLSARE